ncbi:hypothetical protein Franean1_4650 [Parafrankia sp. EAN1pec]|nr:hypothetical protein Franean1_4650 [Frankia sp. EAN1pec]
MPDQEPVNTPEQASRDSRRWWILLVVSAAQFMVGLDATVVNVMMPELQDSLGLSATGLQWVMSIYVLLFGGLMLLGGRLTDVIGRRRILLAGLAESVACQGVEQRPHHDHPACPTRAPPRRQTRRSPLESGFWSPTRSDRPPGRRVRSSGCRRTIPLRS